jgi:dienelactone hydrolase
MRKTTSISPLPILLATLPFAAFAQVAHAADECKVEGKLVSYSKPTQLPQKFDTRCDNANGKCKKLDLKGWLYTPKGAGKHPVLVYNHGSGEPVHKGCEIAEFFTDLGYVVFMPQRRGHGESTGIYLSEYVQDHCSKKGQGGFCKMEYLHEQVGDVKAAVEYVKKLPKVDPKQVALMGHSFGGIVTTFANAKDFGQQVAIDFAGASQSWEGNPDARKEMKEAVKNAVAPLFFFEPLNDKSIEPTIELAKVAGASCRQFQSALFPAVDVDKDGSLTHADYSNKVDADGDTVRDTAHGKSTKQTHVWGPAVHEFMQRYFKKPAMKFDHLCIGTSYVEP